MKKSIAIQRYSFKSKTILGRPAKFYITTYDNGVIEICKLFIDYKDHCGYFKLVRRFNNIWVYKEEMALKTKSILGIANELATLIKDGKLTIN